MLVKVYFLIAITSTLSHSRRLSRSASLWQQPVPEHDKQKDKYDIAWNDWKDEHDSGYLLKKDGHLTKDGGNFKHAVKHETEEHALKSAAGAGKHASVAAKKDSSKHIDQASIHGKDVKGKTFGFFDYHYKQPEYHVEQFYTDEKHRQKTGADHLHHTSKDHELDAHKASGWGKHGKGYHNDAKGIDSHKSDGEFHDGWSNNFQKGYEHEDEKDYSKGHRVHGGHYHHDVVPQSSPPPPPHHHHHHHHHHGYQDGWVAPYDHGHGHGWDKPSEYDIWGKSGHGWQHD